jgi:WD40 repeat protein
MTMDVVERNDADGNPIKLGVPNNTTKVWDTRTGKLKRSLGEEKHTHVNGVAFSADRETAAVAVYQYRDDEPSGGVKRVKIVNTRTWEVKQEIDSMEAGMGWSAIALSPDGKKLALVGWKHGRSDDPETPLGAPLPVCLKFWDVEKEKLIERKRKADEPPLGEYPHCLTFSPDGKVLAAGDKDGKIRLFDGQSGEPKGVLNDHTGSVYRIAFSPDGKSLVSCGEDKTVKLWDVPGRKVRRTLQADEWMSFAVAFSPDGRLVATGSGEKLENGKFQPRVNLWDAKTGERIRQLPAMVNTGVIALAFSPDGGTLAVAGGSLGDAKDGARTAGELRLWTVP